LPARPRQDAATDDHVPDVVASDQARNVQPERAADQEEDRGGQRHRCDIPTPFAAERIEIDRQTVEAQSGRSGQDHEATRDHPPSGKLLGVHPGRRSDRCVRIHASNRSIDAASDLSASVTVLPASCVVSEIRTRFHELDQSG
jgi:hypothetical protein